MSGIYSQRLLDHAKKPAIDALKTTSQRVIEKTSKSTGDLIGNKVAKRITKYSNNSQKNSSETVTNETDKEITIERYTSLEKIQKLIDDLRLI